MDLDKMLESLYGEKERLDRAINALEDLQRSIPDGLRIKSRRGRKSMGPEERQDVSVRMKNYWSSRRAGKQVVAPTLPGPPIKGANLVKAVVPSPANPPAVN